MGWERRGTHGPFYYRVSRDAQGRVVKEYVGRGARADAAAEAVAGREADRAADRRSVAGEVAGLAALDRLTEEMDEGVRLLLDAHLLACGYHRINFGPWRKRRGQEGRTGAGAGSGPDVQAVGQRAKPDHVKGTDVGKKAVPAPEVVRDIQAVVRRAKKGDASVLPRLRVLLAEFPDLARRYGDLAAQAEVAWAALAAGPTCTCASACSPGRRPYGPG